MGQFASQLAAFAAKAKANINFTVAETYRGLALAVVERSPVGDPALWASKPPRGYEGGRFKANWQGQVGSIDVSTTDDIDPTGEVSLASIFARIPENAAGTVFYITNSLPYAIALEDGHSNQAPMGIVGLTVLEFNQIVTTAALKVIK